MSGVRGVRKLMARAAGRAANMLARGVISRVDDARLVQEIQAELLADETADELEHFQTYGLTSNPPAGLEAIVAFITGLRSHGVVVAVGDRKFRLRNLPVGEVALYDDLGQVVHLTREGIVVRSTLPVTIEADRLVVTATTDVAITAPSVVVDSADIQLGGAGGKKVALDGDDVVAGKVVASSAKVTAS